MRPEAPTDGIDAVRPGSLHKGGIWFKAPIDRRSRWEPDKHLGSGPASTPRGPTWSALSGLISGGSMASARCVDYRTPDNTTLLKYCQVST